VSDDLVTCPICGLTGAPDGPEGLIVHLLETHPYSAQAEVIQGVRRTGEEKGA
jgi:hypothetical protein